MAVPLSAEEAEHSRFARGLMDLLERVEYRPAVFGEDIEEIYRLRYRAYRREGSIPPNARGICEDELDDLPNCFRFGVYLDGTLAASLRIHHITRETPQSTSMTSYPDLVGPLLEQGHALVDPSRFTADEEIAKAFPTLPFLTLRIAAMASVHFNAAYCLACVRPEHGAFYRRVFMAERWAAGRSFPGLSFPVSLFAAEVPVIRDAVYRRFPFFMSTKAEQRLMFRRDPNDLAALTVLPTARFAGPDGLAAAA